MTDRLLSIAEVIHRTSLSRASIYAQAITGEFPPSIKVSTNRVAWPETVIAAWIADKIGTAYAPAVVA
jgi:prophage regulatory protein